MREVAVWDEKEWEQNTEGSRIIGVTEDIAWAPTSSYLLSQFYLHVDRDMSQTTLFSLS